MNQTLTKEDWTAMFREIGLDDEAMMKWHRIYEMRHPESHEDFLLWLGIPAAERAEIRKKS